jgi:hypothetical protein
LKEGMKGRKNERKDGWMDGKRREKRMGEICIICIGAVTKLFTHDDVRNLWFATLLCFEQIELRCILIFSFLIYK